ncbi:IS66 family insertion sequence element accessory protein TnpB [Ensifer aridi]|uniref:IS66 family insertion sequence element accessory protein TnpB n=1 Tax=Ensifer aridi TaxID=1708715 RepID=UPI003CCA37B2
MHNRKGAASLMALVRDGALDPFNGSLYVFRSKRADRVRIVWWDGSGVCLYSNDRRSYYTSFPAS